ncbi:MAG: hypothetical protein BZY88_19445 [SAR202 cluster bacterium Io17-Chloro-G9]|nr:MAG: hypothetical protein BZY88_19445 [SAR202 cluster bacterium Io17-Chloro-G9]
MYEQVRPREALYRLQSDLPRGREKIESWLERHRDDVLALIWERTAVVTGELLGIRRKSIYQWYGKCTGADQ